MPLSYVRPLQLGAALDLLRNNRWTILAGGTDFYPALQGQRPSTPVLDITALSDLGKVATTPDGVRIGALATWTDVVRAGLPAAFDALKLAAVEVGSVQIQNRATVAGNLCNASPAADGVPPLLCLDAQVELMSHRGTRQLPLGDYILGNRRTQLAEDELLSAIVIPRAASTGSSAFRKLGARRYLVISIAMVAVRLVLSNDNRIESISIAVGSCSEVATRLTTAETSLQGQQAETGVEQLLQAQHLAALQPIDDIRAPAGYRQEAALQLLRRTVADAVVAAKTAGATT